MKFLLIMYFSIIFISCESESDCLITDYLGNWKGTYKCDTFQAENINLKLIQANTENQIKIEGSELNDEILNFSDCYISIAKNLQDFSYKITGELNDTKNILTLRKEFTSDQGVIFCNLILVR